MCRVPHCKRREDGHDVGPVLSVAARQARLLTRRSSVAFKRYRTWRTPSRPPSGGGEHHVSRNEHAEGKEHVEGNGDDGARWSGRTSLHADERGAERPRALSPIRERPPRAG